MAAHATSSQLADWIGVAVPPDAQRLLDRASRLVDGKVTTGYKVDDAGVPTDVRVRDGLRDATCAQVEFWLGVGEEHDVEGVRGEISTPGASFTLPPELGRRARRELVLAGLMAVTVV